MKLMQWAGGLLLAAAVLAGGWVVFFHSELIKPERKPEEPDPVTDVGVQTVRIAKATLHRYVECYGVVQPAQRRAGAHEMAASARVAAPVAGVVADVFCAVGQSVEQGAALFQLDERTARAEEGKNEAAVASAQATLARLKASTRPEQIAVAEIALEKTRQASAAALQADERVRALLKEQLASEKQAQESAQALAAARGDQRSAEKQLALLKNSPAPEELHEAAAKITEAEKALAASRLLRSLLSVKAPLTGTVVKLNVNPGEPVDTTTILAEIIDLQRLEVSAAIPAAEMKWLKAGEKIEVRSAAAVAEAAEKSADDNDTPVPSIQTTLLSLGLQIDPKTDTLALRAALPAESGMRPGQTLSLKLTVEEHADCLVVPEKCVFKDKVGIDVIAVVENDKSTLQNVTPGLHENGLVEISGSEIKAGGVVVAAGANGFPEETKVHVTGTLEDRKK